MTDFNDRRRGEEAKYAHDSATQFKITNRRNRLVGEWAAEKLGKSGDEVSAYAKEVVAADFEEAGDEDVIRKLKGDFETAGVACDDAEIRAQLEEKYGVARDQVMNESE